MIVKEKRHEAFDVQWRDFSTVFTKGPEEFSLNTM